MKLRHRVRLWIAVAVLTTTLALLFIPWGPFGAMRHSLVAEVALRLVFALAAGFSAKLIFSRDRLAKILPWPAAITAGFYGEIGLLLVFSCGWFVVVSHFHRRKNRRSAPFLSRSEMLRRVFDPGYPDERSYAAVLGDFSGSPSVLRPAVQPIAFLPASLALPLLERLSFSSDSVTRLTASKRRERILATLREDAERPTLFRDTHHARIRAIRAEAYLLLARFGATDDADRRLLQEYGAALAFVAAKDHPGGDALTEIAAVAAAKIGASRPAESLVTHILNRDIRDRATRTIALCGRFIGKNAPASRAKNA